MSEAPVLRLAVALPSSVNHSHQNAVRRSRKTGGLYTAQVPTGGTLAWRAAAYQSVRRAIMAACWHPITDGCRRCHAVLSAYRHADEPAGLCTACAAAEAAPEEWRLLDPESLVLAVAGVLASAVADRPGERAHVQAELEASGIIADHIDVHLAVAKLRRRYGWSVDAVEGLAGYRLAAWPFRLKRHRR